MEETVSMPVAPEIPPAPSPTAYTAPDETRRQLPTPVKSEAPAAKPLNLDTKEKLQVAAQVAAQKQEGPLPKPVKAPPGHRFGLGEDRVNELAAELKAQKPVEVEKPKAEKPKPSPKTPRQAVANVIAAQKNASAVVGDYFDNPESDHHEFLGRLYDHLGEERYEKYYEAFRDAHEEQLRADLRVPVPNHIADEHLRQIPRHLRQTAVNLSPDIWETVARSPRETALQILEGARELEQSREREHQHQVDSYHRHIDQSAWQTRAYIDQFDREGREFHGKTLESWQPTGDKDADADLRDTVMAAVEMAMSRNPLAQEWHKLAFEHLKYAGFYYAGGDKETARLYVDQAKELAAEFNEMFTKELKKKMNSLGPWLKNMRVAKPREARVDTPKIPAQPVKTPLPLKSKLSSEARFLQGSGYQLSPARLAELAEDFKARR